MKQAVKFILITALSFFAADSFSQTHPKKSAKQLMKEGYVKGVVRDKAGLDGCGYIIELSTKENIQVGKLDSAFMRKNLKVWVKYETLKKQPLTTCMAGKVVQLKGIGKRK